MHVKLQPQTLVDTHHCKADGQQQYLRSGDACSSIASKLARKGILIIFYELSFHSSVLGYVEQNSLEVRHVSLTIFIVTVDIKFRIKICLTYGRLRVEQSGFRIPAGARIIPHLQNCQNDSGTTPASYSICTGVIFRE